MANKQMFLNIGLNEIKKMTPEEMFFLIEQIKDITRQMEMKRLQQNGI